MVTINIKFLN